MASLSLRLGRRPEAVAGILASRALAQPALARMFCRARRTQTPMLLAHLAPLPRPGRPAEAPDRGRGAFSRLLAAEVRLTDLLWWEAGAVIVGLFDGADDPAPLGERLRQLAAAHGAPTRWSAARFPHQGLTLEALLGALADGGDQEPGGRRGRAPAAPGAGERPW